MKAELGATSTESTREDDWLRRVWEYLQKIVAAPEKYVQSWDLEKCEGVTATMISELTEELNRQVEQVLATPMGERGNRGDD